MPVTRAPLLLPLPLFNPMTMPLPPLLPLLLQRCAYTRRMRLHMFVVLIGTVAVVVVAVATAAPFTYVDRLVFVLHTVIARRPAKDSCANGD